MSKSVESLQSTSGKQPESAYLQIQLILEETAQADSIITDLPHWFSTHRAQLYVTHAAKPISDTKWFFHEARNYLETLVEKQRLFKERTELTGQALQDSGFSVHQNALSVISDEGCHRLLDDLKQEPKDLLVIASGWPPSSFSLCLARHASCPVLLLRTPLKSRIGRLVVMLATDGSEAAAMAACRLPELVQSPHLSVTAVTVEQPYYIENIKLAPFVNTPALEAALEKNTTIILDISRSLLEEKGIHALDCIRLSGNPAHELLKLAREKLDPDLIVVGAHNRSALADWLLGSVSQRLLHNAPYNLLIVR